MRVYSYAEYPNKERYEKMTLEELEKEIERLEEESKNLKEWPQID